MIAWCRVYNPRGGFRILGVRELADEERRFPKHDERARNNEVLRMRPLISRAGDGLQDGGESASPSRFKISRAIDVGDEPGLFQLAAQLGDGCDDELHVSAPHSRSPRR
jgi:hypothetical protein